MMWREHILFTMNALVGCYNTMYSYFTQLNVCIYRRHEVGKISVREKKFLYRSLRRKTSGSLLLCFCQCCSRLCCGSHAGRYRNHSTHGLALIRYDSLLGLVSNRGHDYTEKGYPSSTRHGWCLVSLFGRVTR